MLWMKSFNQQIFDFFFQILHIYLQNYKKKITGFRFESFGLTMFNNANNPEKINEILTKNFHFDIQLPSSFHKDLKKFILKEKCIRAYHCLHQAIDNDKIDPSITLNDTKDLIIKILDQLEQKGKIFVYNEQFWKDSYALTLSKSQFIGIPDNYFNAITFGESDNCKLLLMIIIFHEIAHLLGLDSYKKNGSKGTPEKFFKVAGQYAEFFIFGKIMDEDFIVMNDLGVQFYKMGVLEMTSEKMFQFFSEKLGMNMNYDASEKSYNHKIFPKCGRCLYISLAEDFFGMIKEIETFRNIHKDHFDSIGD